VNAPSLRVTKSQLKTIDKKLCGITDCQCRSFDIVTDTHDNRLEKVNEWQNGTMQFDFRRDV
jgi:hypothetical protein